MSLSQLLEQCTTHLANGRLDQAIAAAFDATKIDPNSAEAYKALGTAFHYAGRFDQAAMALQRSDRLRPGDPQVANLIGASLQRIGQPDQARYWFEQTLGVASNDANGHYQRGIALDRLDRLEEAVAEYRISLRLDTALWPGGLGAALQKLGRTDEALACYEQALRMRPDYPLAHYNLGYLLLLKGRYLEGWPEYAWRWKCPTQHAPMPLFRQPLWRGEAIDDKTILLHMEQGLGDVMLALRYVPMVQRRARRVLLACASPLVSLVSGSMPGITLVRQGDREPEFDVHAPLLDLPMIFGTTVETIPADVPYLRADPQKVVAWANKLKETGNEGLKVGLVWAGGPKNPGDRERSIALSTLAPLAEASPGQIRFVSLQKGAAAEHAKMPPPGMILEDYTADLHDLGDTAALVECLDLVIAVDTAVAHLAGALGKRVWVLLPFAWYWLWMEHRADTPWYPTMRLYRQICRGEWNEPAKHVARDLRALVAQAHLHFKH